MTTVYAGTERVSIQFGLRAGSVCEGWFTAYDLRFSKYSPGMLQIRHMAESLAAIGITEIRMGKGASPYAQELKSHDMFVGEGTVYTRTPLGVAQLARAPAGSTRWTPAARASGDAPHGRAGPAPHRALQPAARQDLAAVVAGPGEDRVGHLAGHPAGERVLLARVVAADEQHGGSARAG